MPKELKFEVKYRVPSFILYKAFTQQDDMGKYTQSKIVYPNKVNENFSFFDGSIEGKIIELQEGKKIVQSWKFKDWESEAEISLVFKEKKGNECSVSVSMKNIPDRDAFKNTIQTDSIEGGLKNMFFDRISQFMGYPQNKDESDEDSD